MRSQVKWRVAGAISIVSCAGLAWHGAHMPSLTRSVLNFFIYWGLVAILLLASVFIALLDLRFIHLEYILGKRELYKETLGESQFRKALRSSQRERLDKDRLN